MILSSIVLVLLACTTLVIGVQQSSMRDVVISIGCSVVSGAVLVLSVRERTAAKVDFWTEPAFREEPPLPPATVPLSWKPSPASTVPAPNLDPADSDGPMPSSALPPVSPPATPLTPSSPFEPPLDLRSPGPGALGRLRRRPLAGSGSPHPPATTHTDPGPGARTSGAKVCAAGGRPKPDSPSAPGRPAKAAAARTKARVAPGASAKPAGRKSAGATGPSAARQASRNGAGPVKQARAKETTAKR